MCAVFEKLQKILPVVDTGKDHLLQWYGHIPLIEEVNIMKAYSSKKISCN